MKAERDRGSGGGGGTYVDFHLPVQAVVEQQVVGHPDAVRFHGVSLAVVVVPDVACMDQKQRVHVLTYRKQHSALKRFFTGETGD